VEFTSFEMKGFPTWACSLFASAKLSKVLSSFWNSVAKKSDGDVSFDLTINWYGESDLMSDVSISVFMSKYNRNSNQYQKWSFHFESFNFNVV